MRKLKILAATLAATLLLASPAFADEFVLDIDSGFITHETEVEVPGALSVNLTFFGGDGD